MSSSGKGKQIMKSNQKLIQDLNFSNEIFFGMMSTLQSIYLVHIGKHKQEFENKMFRKYDYSAGYKNKNLMELKSQLQTQIIIFQASRKGFTIENSKNSWKLPHNFTEEQVKQIILKALQTFQRVKDNDSIKMAKDIIKLLGGKFEGLNVDNIKIELEYSTEDKKKFNQNLIKQGVDASSQMDERIKEVQNFNSEDDISAKINPNSILYTLNSTEKPTSFIKEKPQNTKIFLAFQEKNKQLMKKQLEKKQLEKKLEISELLRTCSFDIFENEGLLQDSIQTLIVTKYNLVVAVILDSNNIIQSFDQIRMLYQSDVKRNQEKDSKQLEIDLKICNYCVLYVIYTKDIRLQDLLTMPFTDYYQQWKKNDNTVQIFKNVDQGFYDYVKQMYNEKTEPKGFKISQIQGKIGDIVNLTFSIGTDKSSGQKVYLPFEGHSIK